MNSAEKRTIAHNSACDFISLQKRADEAALVLTRDGYREQAEVIRDLRRFAYAQWDANHVAMGALSRAPSMEPKP